MVRHILFTLALAAASLTAGAQQSLNLYTTSQGIVGFTFAEEPKVTFPQTDVIKVECERITVEFPFSEVEKITFEDGVTAVESIRISEQDAQVAIYDISGRLVRRYERKGQTTVDLSSLPVGTYVVSDGHRSYKVMKR